MTGAPSTNRGELFFDHLTGFMGAPAGRQTFVGDKSRQKLQVLFFENVFKGCMVFASFGLSNLIPAGARPLEVVLPVDDGLAEMPRLIANSLFFLCDREERILRGTLVGGIQAIAPKFALAFGKSAIYFTDCTAFPPEFGKVGSIGDILMGIFISPTEENYVRSHGGDAFETALEKEGVDPFTLRRSPVLLAS